MAERPTITLCMSIDTEEDNWLPRRDGISVQNISALPQLHAFLQGLGARPTYFTAHSVVSDPRASATMRTIAEGTDTEIGGHLHPWNTPPLNEPFVPRNTMMRNLAANIQRAKLETLTNELERVFGTPPTSFRAGRWGLGVDTIPTLVDLGYEVDSSVMPYVNWESIDGGTNFVGAPCTVYRMGTPDFRVPQADGALIEVPVSSGYNRADFDFWHGVHEALHRQPARLLRIASLANRTRFLRKIQLSPETDTTRNMLALAHRLIERDVGFLHMFWHSPSMAPGWSPYGATQADVDLLYRRIGEFVERLGRVVDLEFATVTELAMRAAGNRAHPEARLKRRKSTPATDSQALPLELQVQTPRPVSGP